MPKISQEEYEILSGLYDMWKWVERNEKGEIWVYKDKPTKEYKFRREGLLMGLKNGIFQFIQWEDKKTYNIARLLGEYEEAQHVYSNNELYERFYKESRKNQLPKINREEYKVLKGLDDKWKWIARDENGEVWVYKSKPSKLEKEWDSGVLTNLNNISFLQFIQWEDDEPYNIAELIEEYESEETEVKNIEWLKEEAVNYKKNILEYGHRDDKEAMLRAVNAISEKISQLDEPEVEQLERKIKELESFNDFLIRGNNQLRNAIDNQEVLSKEWISENVEYAYFDILGGSGRLSSATAIIKPKKLQNLLVPKQDEREQLEIAYRDILSRREFLFDGKRYKVVESSTLSEMETVEITEEQVMEWLDNNEFYCHATAETVLENAVDKGELGYYGTKYFVVKKPVIPQFVADWIEKYRERETNVWHLMNNVSIQKDCSLELWSWLWDENNVDVLARAWLDGFTVEEEREQKYYAKVKGWGVNGNDGHAYYSGKFPLSLTMPTESVAHTKDEWKNYGVYEDNADFVKVEELEE